MVGDNARRWKSYTTLYFFGKPGFCKDFANDCKEKVTGIKVHEISIKNNVSKGLIK